MMTFRLGRSSVEHQECEDTQIWGHKIEDTAWFKFDWAKSILVNSIYRKTIFIQKLAKQYPARIVGRQLDVVLIESSKFEL